MPAPYTIEKNVPLQKRKSPQSRYYPFEKMEIGDSFEVKLDKSFRNFKSMRSSIITGSIQFSERNGLDWKFKSRATSENTIRLWRVA